MRLVVIYIAILILALPAHRAIAQASAPTSESSVATIGLRGGYDSNPGDAPEARGSIFATQTLNSDYASGSAKQGYGVSVATANTTYDPRVLAANLNDTVTFNAATLLADNLVLRGTLAASDEQSWSRRQNSLLLRTRLEYDTVDYRLFANLEARIGALNERNYFALGSFLPRDENSAALTAMPGAAYKTAYGEIGVSLSATRVSYLEDYDYIGFRRDNDRLQPNLFYSGKLGAVTLEGSVSAFNALFPAKDFEDVRRILYTAKLNIPFGWAALDLASSRTVQDTTLPFSVIDVVDQHESRLTAKFWSKNAVGFFVRQKTEDYLGLYAKATTRSIGLEYARNLGDGLAATAAVTARRVKETGIAIPDALTVQIGLQKQLDFRKAGKAPDGKA